MKLERDAPCQLSGGPAGLAPLGAIIRQTELEAVWWEQEVGDRGGPRSRLSHVMTGLVGRRVVA